MRPKSIYVGVGISACKILDLEVAMFMKNSDCVYIPLQIIAPNCIHSEYMGGGFKQAVTKSRASL